MRDWREEIRKRLQKLAIDPARRDDIVEELAQHLEDRDQELRAGGASEAEAARAVLAELSDESLARNLRHVERRPVAEPAVLGAKRRHLLGDVWQDLRHGFRALLRQPAFSGAAILALALGIGG